MIRKLQRKFVLAAMLSLFIVFAALITVINVLNYRSVITEADEALQIMSEADLDSQTGRLSFGGKERIPDADRYRSADRADRSAEV